MGLLLSAVRAGDINQQWRMSGNVAATRGRTTALSRKCGQCRVHSRIEEAEH